MVRGVNDCNWSSKNIAECGYMCLTMPHQPLPLLIVSSFVVGWPLTQFGFVEIWSCNTHSSNGWIKIQSTPNSNHRWSFFFKPAFREILVYTWIRVGIFPCCQSTNKNSFDFRLSGSLQVMQSTLIVEVEFVHRCSYLPSLDFGFIM